MVLKSHMSGVGVFIATPACIFVMGHVYTHVYTVHIHVASYVHTIAT